MLHGGGRLKEELGGYNFTLVLSHVVPHYVVIEPNSVLNLMDVFQVFLSVLSAVRLIKKFSYHFKFNILFSILIRVQSDTNGKVKPRDSQYEGLIEIKIISK